MSFQKSLPFRLKFGLGFIGKGPIQSHTHLFPGSGSKRSAVRHVGIGIRPTGKVSADCPASQKDSL